jgi:integrase
MQHEPNRHGAAVIEYDGKRGKVFRIKYRDASGQQVKETVGAERDGWTRRKAEAELRERLVRVERKGYQRPKPLTFGDYARTWLAEGARSQGWKPKTIAVYRNAVDAYLIPAFGTSRLESLRPRDFAEFVRDAMSRPQGKHNRPLSGKFVNLLLNVAYSIFKSAYAEELVDANPVDGVKRPKTKRRRWRILQPAEVARVLKAFTDEQARTMFLTLMLTGLRRFELLGLRWRDVNLVEGTLRISESKSEEGERTIALSPALVDALAAHYRRTAFRGDDELVFCHPERGSMIDGEWYAGEFRSALEAAGITDYVRPFHDARHGALTNMAATSASPTALMATAGHRSMATTKQYLHLAGVAFPNEAQALERRLLGTGDDLGTTLYPSELISGDAGEPEASNQAGS